MGYRDSDDSNFSRHCMGRDADDMCFIDPAPVNLYQAA